HKKKYPFQLSGGEQQRVGLCRAILLNPPFMLLDESFSSLDPETKQDIHAEVNKLQRTEPRCIVMVTHDPEEAIQLGDTQLKFENGKLFPLQS
ncbi:MAG: ATP-binding cassette domain-containing protein, partial [Cyclobacteriaceae bacterium]